MLELESLIQTERIDLKIYQPTQENAVALSNLLKRNQAFFYFLYGIVEHNEPENILEFLEKRSKEEKSYFYGIYLKTKAEVLGFISFKGYNSRNKNGEIGFFIDESFAHQGYMSEAVKELCKKIFAAGIHKIKAEVDPKNINSRTLCEKCGFKLEAILKEEGINRHTGEYKDILIYSLFAR